MSLEKKPCAGCAARRAALKAAAKAAAKKAVKFMKGTKK